MAISFTHVQVYFNNLKTVNEVALCSPTPFTCPHTSLVLTGSSTEIRRVRLFLLVMW